ncbi:hypothetical protein [uncultured Roseobacter sp.]|uniref:hypothetical protein n=1 Tax=uncultured Roseobacter sp. TaxID=114847 RepID=UPI00262CB903|nr:hypothetical protein [uncultured Roseobacter sp.]
MRYLLTLSLLVGCAIAGPLQATTLSYFGATYQETDYFASAPPCCDNYRLRGAYSEAQAARLDVKMDGELEADMHYRLGGYPAASTGSRALELVRAFDGINEFDAREIDGFFRTDSTGSVVEWYFHAYSGFGADLAQMIVSSGSGALAEYNFEYEVQQAPIARARISAFSTTSGTGTGSERASARTTQSGHWAVTPVPLPAGALLLMTAAAGLIGARRFQR